MRRALDGEPRSVRGYGTRDAGFTTILLSTPMDALPLGTNRKLNTAIAAAEALQLIGAFSDPRLMTSISSAFREFINGDGFHGAYGNRIRNQVSNACVKLRSESTTRQAVITLWDSHLDNLSGMLDYPCTIALQFEVEDGKLCMNVVMRSNDVFLGLPYDMFQFTQLQMTVARSLSLAYGWYRHTTLSLHAYNRDIPQLRLIMAPSANVFTPHGIGDEGQPFGEIMQRARQLAARYNYADETSPSEVWYRNALAPHYAKTGSTS